MKPIAVIGPKTSRSQDIGLQARRKRSFGGRRRKGLIVELTPPGRGQMVTHGLYGPDELMRLRAQFSGAQPDDESSNQRQREGAGSSAPMLTPAKMRTPVVDDRVDQLVQEVADLKQMVSELRQQLSEVQELLK